MRSTALSVIHKYIRREMFDFAVRLLRAGSHELPSLRTAFAELKELLTAHAAQEATRVAPLLAKIDPQAAERMNRDHHRLESELEAFERSLHAIAPDKPTCAEDLYALHLSWNRHLAAYLQHLDEEERTLFAPIATSLPKVGSLIDSAKAQGAAGEEFLLRLWAVTTCEERAELEAAQLQATSAAA